MSQSLKSKLNRVQKSTVPKAWSRYRREKAKIMSMKRTLPEIKRYRVRELLDDTRKRVSYEYKQYREFKYLKTHVSDIEGFDLVGRYKGEKYKSKTYKAKGEYNARNLTGDVSKLLKKEGNRGVLVKITGIDKNGNPVISAKFYNKDVFEKRKTGVYSEVRNLSEKKYGRITKQQIYIEDIR